jgi:glycosyltransferase involved in cell wall biosynthesis
VIANGPRGASAARNEGARIARADLLLFCDADDVVSPLWVDVMVDTLAHSDAVAGPVSLSALNDANVVARSRGFPTGGLISARGFLPHARTANLGVRTTVFWELEGFDESYKFGEDTAFVWTLQLQGHTILEAADAIVEYRLRAEPAAAVRQARRWAESEVLLHRQFGPSGMPRRTIGQATRSWIYLGIRLAPSLRTPHTRVEWRRGIAKNVGRAIGSVRYHHFYP